MDQPIFVRPGIRVPYPADLKYVEPDEFSPLEALQHAALFDNKEEYINVIKNWPSHVALPDDAWNDMFKYDSVACAAAVLDGETDGKFDLMATLSAARTTPLHEAASRGAFKLTAMFLGRGEVVSTRADHDNLGLKEVLPIDVVLGKIRSFICLKEQKWSKPAFKLIVKFCASTCLRSLLETLRLLARQEDVDQQFSKYLNEGKMIEVGALLIVGCGQPSTFLLQGQDGDSEKEGVVELLEIFDRIGAELSAYITVTRSNIVSVERVAAEVAVLFEDGGLHVKCRDAAISYGLDKWLAEDGDEYFTWSKQAQGILSSKYQGSSSHDQLALAASKREHQLFSSCGPQVMGASTLKYQGSSINGRRTYHSSSLKADRNVASSIQLRSSVNERMRFSSFKQCAAVLMALRRGARHV